ncbi:MAG: arginine N-succinyltransferase [Candidatus Desulfacyla sp.]
MEPDHINMASRESEKKSRWGRNLIIGILVAAVASALTYFLVTRYLFPKQFQPVELSSRETVVLDAKLRRLDPIQGQAGEAKGTVPLKPERYDESGASREISFTTRELNALLAKNTDLARKLAIHLSKDMASAKLLIPLDPDLPFFGGKTLKVTAGLELRYANQKPVVALKGVSIWGVPLPNAWLGGIKNVDLIQEFGTEKSFWNTLAAGVEHIQISDGRLTLKLKE